MGVLRVSILLSRVVLVRYLVQNVPPGKQTPLLDSPVVVKGSPVTVACVLT